ncbi:MAG: hypothetical protein AB1782_20705 [Cyanobacteriota bacterium]
MGKHDNKFVGNNFPIEPVDLISFKKAGFYYNPKQFFNDTSQTRRDFAENLTKSIDKFQKQYPNHRVKFTGGYGGGHKSVEHRIYATAVDIAIQKKITSEDGTTKWVDIYNKSDKIWDELESYIEKEGIISTDQHDMYGGQGSAGWHIHSVAKTDYEEYLRKGGLWLYEWRQFTGIYSKTYKNWQDIIKDLEEAEHDFRYKRDKLHYPRLYKKGTESVSPLILDLDGDGVETLRINNNIYFDHNADGFSELTGWVCDNARLKAA